MDNIVTMNQGRVILGCSECTLILLQRISELPVLGMVESSEDKVGNPARHNFGPRGQLVLTRRINLCRYGQAHNVGIVYHTYHAAILMIIETFPLVEIRKSE